MGLFSRRNDDMRHIQVAIDYERVCMHFVRCYSTSNVTECATGENLQ